MIDIDGLTISINGNSIAPEYTSENRPLQGQSPYIVNLNLGYETVKYGFSGILLLNINGKRIERVGLVSSGSRRGDVFTLPVPKLDLIFKQRTHKNKKTEGFFTLSFKNIANPQIREEQNIENSQGENRNITLNNYREGTSMSISYTLTF